MRKERKHFTPEKKVAILRGHLVDKVPVSELCEELGLRPTVFYRWQKELFENGAAAFQSQERPHRHVEGEAETNRVLGEEDADQRQGPS
jgi:transposase